MSQTKLSHKVAWPIALMFGTIILILMDFNVFGGAVTGYTLSLGHNYHFWTSCADLGWADYESDAFKKINDVLGVPGKYKTTYIYDKGQRVTYIGIWVDLKGKETGNNLYALKNTKTKEILYLIEKNGVPVLPNSSSGKKITWAEVDALMGQHRH